MLGGSWRSRALTVGLLFGSGCAAPVEPRLQKLANEDHSAALAQASQSSRSSESPGEDSICWDEGFTWEHCCGQKHGFEGNPECWDEVYTYETCGCAKGPGGAGSDAMFGCNGKYFTRFREVATEYYETGRLRPELTTAHQMVLANFDARFKLCAPAALQAMLLKLEDDAFLKPGQAVLSKLAQYSVRLHQGFEQGLLSPSDLKSWPLAAGLERVRQGSVGRVSSPVVQSARQPSVPVTLVVSYCRESLYWLNTTVSRALLPFVDLTLIRKCPGVDALSAVPHRHMWRSIDIVDVEDLPLRADECSAYVDLCRLG